MDDELFQNRCFHAAGAALACVEGPLHGLPLLLIHGTGSRWQPFQAIMPALAERYHVYALDLRGHGRSSHLPGAYRLEDYTRDIAQFISQAVNGPVAIYGHSLGALVGMNLAAQQPGWVRSLVLGDPPFFYHDTPISSTPWHSAFKELLAFMLAHPISAEMESWLAQNMPGMSPERREERVRSLETLDPDVVRAMISNELMENISFPALFLRITCPVLLLRGNPALGSALRPQDVDFAIAHFSNIRVLEMESTGHGIIPPPLLPQLMAFLNARAADEDPQQNA